jgi:hypothetical protein
LSCKEVMCWAARNNFAIARALRFGLIARYIALAYSPPSIIYVTWLFAIMEPGPGEKFEFLFGWRRTSVRVLRWNGQESIMYICHAFNQLFNWYVLPESMARANWALPFYVTRWTNLLIWIFNFIIKKKIKTSPDF